MMQPTVEMFAFKPADAERVTGVATQLQRDWRGRGYLAKSEGHARYDIFGLAGLWVLKMASDRGIGPSVAKDIRDQLGGQIGWWALRNVGAWQARAEQWDAVPEQNHEGERPTPFRGKLRHLANMALFGRAEEHDVNRYFIWWPDGSFTPSQSIDGSLLQADPAWQTASGNAGKIGFPLVLDAETMARVLLERIGGPVATFDVTVSR